MSLYGTFTSGSGSSSSKMAAMNEPKVFDTTTTVVAADGGFGDGGKDGGAGWLS
jgi:hypothetical protein